MNYSITETKTAIGDVLRAAAPNAVVFERWALSSDSKKWPGQMRSASDSDRTHGYAVELMASTDSRDAAIQAPGYMPHLEFRIVGLHWHDTTTDTSALFFAEIEAIAAAFRRQPGAIALGTATRLVRSFSYEHDVTPIGNETCHVFYARLEIKQC